MRLPADKKRPSLPECTCGAHETGAAYMMLMLTVLTIGAGLAALSDVWHTALQREKEQELLFIGNQFRQAIGQYYRNTPGQAPRYPKNLEDLLKDPRFPGTQRYLRKIFTDPMTGEKKWGTIRDPNGGILGIRSMSDKQPIKQSNFGPSNKRFENLGKYSEWVFIHETAK